MVQRLHRQFHTVTAAFILAAATGLFAGITGGALVALWLVPKLNISTEREPARRLASVGSGPISSETFANTVSAAVVVFLPRNAVRDLGVGTWYAPNAVLARGTALTSDGWVATDAAAPLGGAVAVAADGERLIVEKVVADQVTGISFIKLGRNDFPSLSFARSAPAAGEAALVTTGRRSLLPTVAIGPDPGGKLDDALLAAESLNRTTLLAAAAGAGSRGSPVFNAALELAGIIVGERGDGFIPLVSLAPALPSLFKTGAVHRPFLGIRTIDASLLGGNSSGSSGRGALLLDLPGKPSVRPGSPGAAAGFVSGDLITEIEGTPLSPGQSLAEALRDYHPGDRISFFVRRGEKLLTLTAELGDSARMR